MVTLRLRQTRDTVSVSGEVCGRLGEPLRSIVGNIPHRNLNTLSLGWNNFWVFFCPTEFNGLNLW